MAQSKRGFKYLLAAALATVVLAYFPLAWLIVYPFRLFVTFIHESGHAFAALLTGGSVSSLSVNADASGETVSRGGIPLIIASAGYLASTIYGATLLALCRDGRNAKAALSLTATAILGVTIFFGRDVLTITCGLVLSVVLVFLVLGLKESWAHFFTSLLAIQCCLNALFDLKTLFLLSAIRAGGSDAANMAQMTGIPALFWALLWLAISVLCLVVGLRSYGNPYARQVGTMRRRRAYSN